LHAAAECKTFDGGEFLSHSVDLTAGNALWLR
jgi:hypothetical protein